MLLNSLLQNLLLISSCQLFILYYVIVHSVSFNTYLFQLSDYKNYTILHSSVYTIKSALVKISRNKLMLMLAIVDMHVYMCIWILN